MSLPRRCGCLSVCLCVFTKDRLTAKSVTDFHRFCFHLQSKNLRNTESLRHEDATHYLFIMHVPFWLLLILQGKQVKSDLSCGTCTESLVLPLHCKLWSGVRSLIWLRSASLEAGPVPGLRPYQRETSVIPHSITLPLGCISHSSFVWPSLQGISNAGLVLPPRGSLTGRPTGTVTPRWWICSGLTLLGSAPPAPSGQRWT